MAFRQRLLRRILDVEVPASLERATDAARERTVARDECCALSLYFQGFAQDERDQIGFFLRLCAGQHGQSCRLQEREGGGVFREGLGKQGCALRVQGGGGGRIGL